jgi:hypothetical protein
MSNVILSVFLNWFNHKWPSTARWGVMLAENPCRYLIGDGFKSDLIGLAAQVCAVLTCTQRRGVRTSSREQRLRGRLGLADLAMTRQTMSHKGRESCLTAFARSWARQESLTDPTPTPSRMPYPCY